MVCVLRSRLADVMVLGLVVFGVCSGSSVAAPSAPVAEISATVSAEVQQDQVQIVLSAQVQDDSAAAVNQRLTEMIDQAKSRIGNPSGLRVSTGNVQTYPRYDDNGKISGWQGRADLVLRSNDVSLSASSADKVADLLALSGVSFSLSDQARRAEQSRLMDSVAHAFREKATTTARVFGYSSFSIQSLNISDSGEMSMPRPFVMAAVASDRAEKAGLTLVPDVQTVSVTVSGLIELR
ncbi:SIMPL domain-containing protein [Orrella marina]|uniref:DUF541 domain-containing protein n=1 Tax=Orrella marina TaxID=2163011 RepID=A0A2R4XPQ3_9BURK|nr:SIMPL domain-containing protein [Orrella marina]AWB35794.1 hypothetical protein DBV39_11910 [Orrella marina]